MLDRPELTSYDANPIKAHAEWIASTVYQEGTALFSQLATRIEKALKLAYQRGKNDAKA